jgi:hypothetical protein
MTITMTADTTRLELNDLAAEFFGATSPVAHDRFRTLGPEAPANSPTALGSYLLDRLIAAPQQGDGSFEFIQADSMELIATYHGSACTLYRVTSPAAAKDEARDLRHALRNHINAINMNAELIELLATRAGDARISECAARIGESCGEAARALEP